MIGESILNERDKWESQTCLTRGGKGNPQKEGGQSKDVRIGKILFTIPNATGAARLTLREAGGLRRNVSGKEKKRGKS